MNIYAQIVGTVAVVIMFCSYLKTTKAKYLFLQILSNIFYATQFFLLGAFSATGICIITIFKSVVFYIYESKNKKIPIWSLILFELITIAFGIYIYTGFNSMLPIIIACIVTYTTWQKKLDITYFSITVTSIVWVVYNLSVGAYAVIIGNVIELIASLSGLYKLSKVRKKLEIQ